MKQTFLHGSSSDSLSAAELRGVAVLVKPVDYDLVVLVHPGYVDLSALNHLLNGSGNRFQIFQVFPTEETQLPREEEVSYLTVVLC